MRFLGFAMMASAAIVLSACGGDKTAATDSAAMGASASAVTPPAGEMTPPAAGTMVPVTGTMHEVKMIGDGTSFRFDPENITIKAGDGIKWTMVSGGPHNVAFDVATVPAAAKSALTCC